MAAAPAKPWKLIFVGAHDRPGGVRRMEHPDYPGTFVIDQAGRLWKLLSMKTPEREARYMPVNDGVTALVLPPETDTNPYADELARRQQER